MHESLTEDSFVVYAAKNYINPSLDDREFYDDLKRFKYIKRLFNQYQQTNDIKERLILNHIIVIYNVFLPEAATKMLFVKLKGYYQYLKPFLILLNYLPDKVYSINGINIDTSDIAMDPRIVELLRKI